MVVLTKILSQQDPFFFFSLLSLIVSCHQSWPTCFSFFDVTPVCSTGGQLDQRGTERRRSAGSSLQRSHHGSGRGGGGRRGKVGVTQPPHHSSLSICRFLSSSLYLSVSLTICYAVKLWSPSPKPSPAHPAVILLLPCLSSVCLCRFLGSIPFHPLPQLHSPTSVLFMHIYT